MTDIDIKIQWHSPDSCWAAVLVRDGEPWYLNGALVGMNRTIDTAVEDLIANAGYLIETGENFLTEGHISMEDRVWLFELLDRGNDHREQEARYVAMRQAGMRALDHGY